ncbi:hypothetical protein FS749_002084 [Ceratobasidium sp. UAMH 11750]|nr:hypothetical protein FS749_002084 [Ceratobasidium sp. UAMH 11750]
MSEPNPVAFDRIPFPNLTPPIQDQSKPLVSVSTRFNPEKKDIQDADVVLITEDRVYFYAHREILLGRSSNNFGSLFDVSDELAQQMGPVYLRRLFFLHLGRADALKRLLYPPPLPHPASDLSCDPRSQQEVGRIWALACASVVVENHPNELVKVVTPLSAQLSCPNCRQTLNDRVAALIRDWGAVKATI